MSSPVKREAGDNSEQLRKKSKSNTPLNESEPAFDLSPQDNVISEIMPRSNPMDFSSDVPTPFDDLMGDNPPLPKTSAPSTDLNRNNSNSASGLALLSVMIRRKLDATKGGTRRQISIGPQ